MLPCFYAIVRGEIKSIDLCDQPQRWRPILETRCNLVDVDATPAEAAAYRAQCSTQIDKTPTRHGDSPSSSINSLYAAVSSVGYTTEPRPSSLPSATDAIRIRGVVSRGTMPPPPHPPVNNPSSQFIARSSWPDHDILIQPHHGSATMSDAATVDRPTTSIKFNTFKSILIYNCSIRSLGY